jgi:uncharacterized phage infection (PIP) family protein YhgE
MQQPTDNINPMSTQAKEILEKHCPSMNRIYLDDQGMAFRERILAAMQEYADLQTKDIQQEVEDLKRWKREQLEVWAPIDIWAQKNPAIKLGQSKSKFVLKTLQDYQQLKDRLEDATKALQESKHESLCLSNSNDLLKEVTQQLKERADKLAEAMDRIKGIADQYYQTLKNPSANHLSLIASEALASWKEGGLNAESL